MALYPLDKQTAGCNLPHDWLMNLTIDCVIYGSENGTNGCHLALFSVDVAFTYHLVASHHPLLSNPIRVLVVLAMPLQLAQLAIHSMVGAQIDYEQLQNCGKLRTSVCLLPKIQYFKQLKLVFLNIHFVIVCGSWVFSNLVISVWLQYLLIILA